MAAVEPFDGETGRLHLVHLEYADGRAPVEERLLWELEPNRGLLPPNALPDPAHPGGAMPAEDFDALLRAARWTALSPYLDSREPEGGARREPVASPFHGGVRIENYQLVPLLKALRMPRVSLLIVDASGVRADAEGVVDGARRRFASVLGLFVPRAPEHAERPVEVQPLPLPGRRRRPRVDRDARRRQPVVRRPERPARPRRAPDGASAQRPTVRPQEVHCPRRRRA